MSVGLSRNPFEGCYLADVTQVPVEERRFWRSPAGNFLASFFEEAFHRSSAGLIATKRLIEPARHREPTRRSELISAETDLFLKAELLIVERRWQPGEWLRQPEDAWVSICWKLAAAGGKYDRDMREIQFHH
ncbi:hypothetical protein [Rhizobium sp. BT-226]|uniref:hypothetical protein n=1 Tax=Rhizobium sp. BT-226 TaxID=2986922 RepID=UPI0021F6C7B2|nr:hypothetical protein [Rhizobium sp. BT-226]MCW0018926.1 hypothetical protein [Rhizobium sp. BT-226]